MIRLAISADCHVTEPLDLWTKGLPAGLRERGPRVERRDDRTCLVVENRVIRRFPRVPGGGEGPTLEQAWNADDPQSRIAALEKDGVWAELMYPNLAFFTTYAIEDPALQVASCRVYNDWVADTYAGAERSHAVALLPLHDVDAAVRELERVGERGLRAALLPTHSDRRPYNDPAYEPLWETAAGLRLPLSFHVGTGRSQTPAHGPGGAVVNYVVTVSGAMETVAYLCGSGVLERHPDLRVVMVECGAGWLAWTLEAMDDAYREHHMFVRPKLAELPSAYFRRQGAVTFQRDPVGLANLPHTGARCLLWGSDYPHPEGTWPDSRASLDEQLAGLEQDVVDQIVWRNAAELYSLPLPDGVLG